MDEVPPLLRGATAANATDVYFHRSAELRIAASPFQARNIATVIAQARAVFEVTSTDAAARAVLPAVLVNERSDSFNETRGLS